MSSACRRVMTAHAKAICVQGCTHTNTSLQTSTLINSTDCSTLANNNEGCITTNPSQQSYGEDFANNGGGVFVTEFATTGIA